MKTITWIFQCSVCKASFPYAFAAFAPMCCGKQAVLTAEKALSPVKVERDMQIILERERKQRLWEIDQEYK